MKRRILRAVPVTFGLMVTASLYGAAGGRHPFVIDAMVTGLAGLVTYLGLRHLVDDALYRANDTEQQ